MTNETGSREPQGWLAAAVHEHEHALVRYVAGITGDLERARDVVQETFLKLMRSGPPKHLTEWLFTVCRNGALDVLRKEKRMSPLTEGRDGGGQVPPAPAEHEGDHTAPVAAAVAHLPSNQREVIRLRFQNNLAYKQIAAVTGLSSSNVGFLIHSAIKSLRQTLRADARPEGELS